MNIAFSRVRSLGRGTATRWFVAAFLSLAIGAGPLWLWWLPLRSYRLKLDDFVYLARSRPYTSLLQNLATPHNAHVVPLFLYETHLLASLAGTLEALPRVLGWAAYATLMLAMATAGHLVAWETGRAAPGLAAMAVLGFSSVLGPALLWYSASQALAAGTMILAMLVCLQAWRARGSWWWLGLGVMAAVAAPLFWSGGYTAGLVGMAYLWADGRRSCRVAAVAPLAASLATAALVWVFAGRAIIASSSVNGSSILDVVNLPVATVHSAQAICEALVLNNLGLDAPTAAAQAIVLCLCLGIGWTWSKRRLTPAPGRQPWFFPNPLEAAGAVMVVANFAMVFAVRGTETTFENLRALGWYDAIPQLGAVVFAAGWWCGPGAATPPKVIIPPSPGELGFVIVVIGLMLILQFPRVDRVIFEYDGLAAETVTGEDQRLTHRSTPADLVEQATLQRQALAHLDKIERIAREQGIARAATRASMGRIIVPGMPESINGLSEVDMLDIPETEVWSR